MSIARRGVLVGVLVIVAGCGTHLSRHDIEVAAHGAAPQAGAERATSGPLDAGVGATGGASPDANATGASGSASTGGGAASAPKPAGAVVKIGNVGTYSGLIGSLFASGQPTIKAFGRWLNAHGGLNGHPVEIITADDGGDPSRNLSLHKQMVEQHGVIAFVGNLAPLSGGGASSYLAQKHVPVIGGDGVDTAWRTNPMFFPQLTGLTYIVRALPVVGVQAGKHKFALFACVETSLCTDAAEELDARGGVQAAGGTVVYKAQVSLAQPDFTAECLQARRNGADSVIVLGDGSTLSRAATSCGQQSYHPTFVGLGLSLAEGITGNTDLEGAGGAVGTFPAMATDLPAADEFRRAMHELSPSTPLDSSASAAWASGLLLKAAGARVPAGAVTSNDLIEGLYALHGETLGGVSPPLTFVRGKPAPQARCWFKLVLHDRRWTAPLGSKTTCF